MSALDKVDTYTHEWNNMKRKIIAFFAETIYTKYIINPVGVGGECLVCVRTMSDVFSTCEL